jgi:hypothetical protein
MGNARKANKRENIRKEFGQSEADWREEREVREEGKVD